MQVEEIVDRKSLEAYLTDQPRELIELIAARAALRSLPVLVRFFDTKDLKKPAEDYIFIYNRAMLIQADINVYNTQGIIALRDARLWLEES